MQQKLGHSAGMSDDPYRFYIEQAAMCGQAALAASSDEEREFFWQGREAWIEIARLIAPGDLQELLPSKPSSPRS